MLKLRITGTPEEAAALADALEATGRVLERSRPYANRGSSSYVRIYMDVDARGTGHVPVEAHGRLPESH